MFDNYSYPIICTEKYAETVAFYEDYLDYALSFEMNGFAVLYRTDWQDAYIAIIDKNHNAIPVHYQKNIEGMILSYPSRNVQAAYDHLYWEGLSLISDPENTECGRKHFLIEDPNGILIQIAEPIKIDFASEKDDQFHFEEEFVSR